MVETGQSHFHTSSTPFSKVGKMAKARLVALVVLQEVLVEAVPPHCESDDKLQYLATCFGQTVTALRGKPLPPRV